MIDPRFYELVGPKALKDIARIVGADVPSGFDPDLPIRTCGPLGDQEADGLAFFQGGAKAPIETTSRACLVTVQRAGDLPVGTAPLVVTSPRAAFAIAANALVRRREILGQDGGIDSSAQIAEGVKIGPYAVVGSGAQIGAGTSIGPGSVIGPGVVLGENCRIGANVTIYCAILGSRVTIASNSVIGEAGFGVEVTHEGPFDVPQLGRVLLHDDVSIGSLCGVDRGAFGDTVLGEGCKIDNFTQIAHNCQLGRGVIIAAFGGISGSCEIGDHVMMGGRVGIADHTKVGAGATISAAAGVFRDIPPGENWGGVPAQLTKQWHREVIALKKLARQKPSHATPSGQD